MYWLVYKIKYLKVKLKGLNKHKYNNLKDQMEEA